MPVLMSEAELQKQVIVLLKKLGWRYFHIPATAYRHGVRAGFPDITAVRRERLLFIEFKQEKATPTDEQYNWLNALCAVAEVYIWRPSDLLTRHIDGVLL